MWQKENKRIAPLRVQWVAPPARLRDDTEHLQTYLVLTWIDCTRQAYEAAHPEARAVSQELTPLALADSHTDAVGHEARADAAAGAADVAVSTAP